MRTDLEPDNLNKLKVVELREELSERGLETKGNKPHLVERLREFLLTQDSGGDEEEGDDEPVEEAQEAAEQDQPAVQQDVSVDSGLAEEEDTSVVNTSIQSAHEARDESSPPPSATTPDLSALAATDTLVQVAPVAEEETPVHVEELAPQNLQADEPPLVAEKSYDALLENTKGTDSVPVQVLTEEPIVASEEVAPTADPLMAATTAPVETTTPAVDSRAPMESIAPAVEANAAVEASAPMENDAPVVACAPMESIAPDAAVEASVPMENNAPVEACAPMGNSAPVVEASPAMESSAPDADRSTPAVVSADQQEQEPAVAGNEDGVNNGEEAEAGVPTMDSADSQEETPIDTTGIHIKEEPEDFVPPSGGSVKKRRWEDTKADFSTDQPDNSFYSTGGYNAYLYQDEHDDIKSEELSDMKPLLAEETACVLDTYNSDINLKINTQTGLVAEPLTNEGFAFMWAGVMGTYGVATGKVGFEVQVVANLNVAHLPPEEQHPHVVRVGWSVEDAGMGLGEVPLSYGYGGTGKASENMKFKNYGEPFAAGDVISCLVDFEKGTVGFSKNGNYMGVAFSISFDPSTLQYRPLFPHILTKNCKFQVNFGSEPEPWFALPEDFVFMNAAPVDQRIRGPLSPPTRAECQVLMMVGLPACGKTTWAESYVKEHRQKRYNILGTNAILDQMKVQGLSRRKNYHGRWDVLIGMATKCLNKMLQIACRKKRHYIIDQTNVYPSARRRKMVPFREYHRKAVVVVPNEDDFAIRCRKQAQEEGKVIPPEAVLEMKANYTLPSLSDGLFDEVEFVELQEEEAQALVHQYNEEGKAYKPPPEKKRRQGGPPTRHDEQDSRGGTPKNDNNGRRMSQERRDGEGGDGRSGGGRDRDWNSGGGGGWRGGGGPPGARGGRFPRRGDWGGASGGRWNNNRGNRGGWGNRGRYGGHGGGGQQHQDWSQQHHQQHHQGAWGAWDQSQAQAGGWYGYGQQGQTPTAAAGYPQQTQYNSGYAGWGGAQPQQQTTAVAQGAWAGNHATAGWGQAPVPGVAAPAATQWTGQWPTATQQQWSAYNYGYTPPSQ